MNWFCKLLHRGHRMYRWFIVEERIGFPVKTTLPTLCFRCDVDQILDEMRHHPKIDQIFKMGSLLREG